MALQRRANGGVRKNAGDLTPALAKSIIAAVRKTPLSLKASANACGLVVQDLRYMIKRGSLPGADPLWEDTSRRVRELIAAAEARNFARLEAAADGGTFEEVKVERPNLPSVEGEPDAASVLGSTTRTIKLVPAAVKAQCEIQRLIEKDSWAIDPQPEDAPIVYMALFSRPLELPTDILQALIQNGWHHAALDDPEFRGEQARELKPAPDDTPDGTPS
jgi:hypothetical protein